MVDERTERSEILKTIQENWELFIKNALTDSDKETIKNRIERINLSQNSPSLKNSIDKKNSGGKDR